MLEWIKDPHVDTVKSGNKTRAVEDVYAQWLFYWGRKFQQSAKLDRAGFNYFVRSKSLTKAGRPEKIKQGADSPSGHSAAINLLPVAKKTVAKGAINALPHQPADAALDADKIVVVGVIDDGVNVFNTRFRPQGRASRVEYAWAQDGRAPKNNAIVPFGSVMTSSEITAAMGSAPEQELLEKHGFAPQKNQRYMPSAMAQSGSHGTQVADMAAGADPAEPDALHKRLITVQLPAFAVMDTSGASLVAAMHHAAIYVFERARAMSAHYLKPLPVVLNISFGLTNGPRNGQHFLERALRALALKYREDMRAVFGDGGVPPVVRVISAGNENILRLHAVSLEDDKLSLPVRVQPDDQSASFVELWLPQSATDAQLTITLPDGQAENFEFTGLDPSNVKKFDANILTATDNPKAQARVSIDAPHAASTKPEDLFWRLVLCIAPTAQATPAAQMGLWHMAVHAAGADKNIHAWILRSETVSGFASQTRQAYFDDDALGQAAYVTTAFDALGDIAVDDPNPETSVIARDGALSGLATNAELRDKNGNVLPGDGPDLNAISVGARRWDLAQAAIYSAADYNGNGQAPMVMAIAETSRVLPNIRGAGMYSATSAAMNGTSAAAPMVSRLFAQKLSTMTMADYAGFSPLAYVQSQGAAPQRPVNRETATGFGIREDRLANGGVMLPADPAWLANIARDNAVKT